MNYDPNTLASLRNYHKEQSSLLAQLHLAFPPDNPDYAYLAQNDDLHILSKEDHIK